MYEYASRFTGRTLRAGGCRDGEEGGERGGEANAGSKAAKTRPGVGGLGRVSANGFAMAYYRHTARERARRRDARLAVGFDSNLEAEPRPFRSFTALDNLMVSQRAAAALLEHASKQDQALQRIARERERQERKVGPGQNASRCDPTRATTARRLRLDPERALANQKLEIIERSIAEHFTIARLPSEQERRQAAPQRGANARQHAFSGLFVKNQRSSTQLDTQAGSAPLQGELVDSAAQTRFVQFARHGAVEDMMSVFRKHAKGGKFHVDALAPCGLGAVHAAALHGQIAALEYLVRLGARLDVLDAKGRLPVECIEQGPARDPGHANHAVLPRCRAAFKTTSLLKAAQGNDAARLEWLLDLGADTVGSTNRYGNSALHMAFMAEAWEASVLLIDQGADLNAANLLGQRPRDLCSDDFADAVLEAIQQRKQEHEQARKQRQIDRERLDDFDCI